VNVATLRPRHGAPPPGWTAEVFERVTERRKRAEIPSPLREQLVENLARLLVADLEQFPDVVEHEALAEPFAR